MYAPRQHQKHTGTQYCLLAGLCLILATLDGCASVTNRLQDSQLHPPLNVVMLQSPPRLEASQLQAVFAPKTKRKLSLHDKPLAQALRHSQQTAYLDLIADLRHRHNLHPVSPPPASIPLLHAFETTDLHSLPSQQVADALHDMTGADAVLRIGITDYGLTPRTWRSGYITFEVVTTLGVAAVIASVGTSAARVAAEGYLAQETVEETAESYAGFKGLDVVSRPVRIVAQLIQLQPLEVVWQESDTGLSDTRLGRLTGKVSAEERDGQLDQSTDEAINSLVSDLSRSLAGKTAPLPAQLK